MNALIVLVATAALGIEVGWEPLPGGGHEYTIQLEPQLLTVLEGGQQEIFSEVPEGVDVRRYRIVVGVGKLRREYGPLQAKIEQPPSAVMPQASAPVAAAPQPAFEQQTPAPVNAGTLPEPAAGPDFAQAEDPLNVPYATPDLAALPPASAPESAPDFGDSVPRDVEPKFPVATTPPSDTTPPVATEPERPFADPWAEETAQAAPEGKQDVPATSNLAQAPGKLPAAHNPSAPIQPATFEEGKAAPIDGVRDTGKPELGDSPPESRPWGALVIAIVLLACSLGGNVFLGWIAMDARARYRATIAKVRGAVA